ncbi:hypothetical protein LINPERHAP2_LOCUS21194 [Linum perenne]
MSDFVRVQIYHLTSFCEEQLLGVPLVSERVSAKDRKLLIHKITKLGIHDIESWNVARVIRNLWYMLFLSGSIWVAWIEVYQLKKSLAGHS